MNLILSADKNWAIGRQNRLLVSIPADMKFFRETTSNKVVVMGRKTMESLPGGIPLRNRTNIVLTSDRNYQVADTVIVHSLDELKNELKKYDSDDIYIIGGGSIYRLLLPFCQTAYVTKIDHEYAADTYFPDLDAEPDWRLAAVSEERTYFDLEYVFARYERVE